MSSRNWCFTLNNPDIEQGTLPKHDKLRFASWQYEKGQSCTNHIQGYVEFSTVQRLTAMKKWLPTAHFETRKGTREQVISIYGILILAVLLTQFSSLQARDYTTKEDSRISGPFSTGVWESAQGQRTDLDLAADHIKENGLKGLAEAHPTVYIKFHKGLKEFHRAIQPPYKDPPIEKPFPWQQRVLDLVSQPANDRNIIWVVDKAGNRGKSRLASHLVDHHCAVCLEGKIADMAHGYDSQPIVVFDISRASAEHSDHLYSMAEKLKNGLLYSQKYESGQKRFPPPHVVFFSNSWPDPVKYTSDRLITLDLDKTYKKAPKITLKFSQKRNRSPSPSAIQSVPLPSSPVDQYHADAVHAFDHRMNPPSTYAPTEPALPDSPMFQIIYSMCVFTWR